MAQRGSVRAVVAMVGLAAVALAAPAAAAEPAVPPPVEPVRITAPWNNEPITEVHITDGAVYTVGTVTEYPSETEYVRYSWVYRNTLHAGSTGPVLGNTEYLDQIAVSQTYDGSVAEQPDGLVWTSKTDDNRIVRYRDDGTTTRLTGTDQPSVSSCTELWCTSGDALVPIAAGRAIGGVLTGRAQDSATLPWAPVATVRYTWQASVTDTHVVWIENLRAADNSGYGRRLYANAIDADGFVGAPVLVAEGFATDSWDGPFRFDASGSLVAWQQAEDRVLRWVSLADLGATPQERPYTGQLTDIAVDDDRIAYGEHFYPDAGVAGTSAIHVVDAATGDDLTSVPTARGSLAVDLHDDLVAWVDEEFSRGAVRDARVASINPAAPLTALPDFPDVEAWNGFVPEIDQLALRGITTGYADGTFRPWASVNRDAMAAFLYRLAGRPAYTPPAVPEFADVPRNHPFYLEISWLADQGVTTGWVLADGTVEFRPGESVSREATAAFLYRMAGRPAFTAPSTSPFQDVTTGDRFYREIAWLAQTGISTGWDLGGGVTWFGPSWEIERQAMAAFLIRFDDLDL